MARESKITYLNAGRVDFDRLITQASSEYELLEVCSRIAQFHGLPLFSVIRFPQSSDKELTNLGIVSNWPDTLISEYDRNGLFENSPVLEYLRNSSEPLIFDTKKINENRKDEKGNTAVELFQRYEIYHGVYFSVHNAKGSMAAVSFCGPNPVTDKDVFIRLNYLASLIYSRLSVLHAEDDDALYDLNPRELGFLQSVSEGKSIAAIAAENSLSETVVNKYLQNAAMKLGCDSRIHAVSKALRLRLIS